MDLDTRYNRSFRQYPGILVDSWHSKTYQEIQIVSKYTWGFWEYHVFPPPLHIKVVPILWHVSSLSLLHYANIEITGKIKTRQRSSIFWNVYLLFLFVHIAAVQRASNYISNKSHSHQYFTYHSDISILLQAQATDYYTLVRPSLKITPTIWDLFTNEKF